MPSLRLATVVLLACSAVPAQNDCEGFGGRTAAFDLDPTTGSRGHVGVAFLQGEIYVTTAGRGATQAPPHSVHVLGPTGQLHRTFAQDPSTAATLIGWRDGTSDGRSLMFCSELGIHVVDRVGQRIGTILAANGPRTLPAQPIAGPALAALRGFTAVAFDPAGDAGNGSFVVGQGTAPLYEIDLGGGVLRTFANADGLDVTGLELDGCGQLWAWARAADGAIVELDRVTGRATGRSIALERGVLQPGGLALALGLDFRPAGDDLLLVRRTVSGPAADRLEARSLGDFRSVCAPWTLVSARDAEQPDPSFKVLGRLDRTLSVTALGPRPAPVALWLDAGPAALVCGDVTAASPALLALHSFFVLTPFSTPSGPAVTFGASSNTPIALPLGGVVGVLPDGPLRIQALALDAGVPPVYVPLVATNEAEFELDRALVVGVTVTADGLDSFNGDTSRGFFRIENRATVPGRSIVRLELDVTTTPVPGMITLEFDTDEIGMVERFDAGNSTAIRCPGTYRNGSDVATGLVYDALNQPAAPCALGGNSGFVGRNAIPGLPGTFQTIEFRFAPATFFGGALFEFDLDTDAGNGDAGGDMAGIVVTVDLLDGSRHTGVLARVSPTLARLRF
ncbi:MAG: hypothetical protein IPM29_13950 [Planctomycetes bacterium]|nr:hypothetical protein [Planctomycetota bacterium]